MYRWLGGAVSAWPLVDPGEPQPSPSPSSNCLLLAHTWADMQGAWRPVTSAHGILNVPFWDSQSLAQTPAPLALHAPHKPAAPTSNKPLCYHHLSLLPPTCLFFRSCGGDPYPGSILCPALFPFPSDDPHSPTAVPMLLSMPCACPHRLLETVCKPWQRATDPALPRDSFSCRTTESSPLSCFHPTPPTSGSPRISPGRGHLSPSSFWTSQDPTPSPWLLHQTLLLHSPLRRGWAVLCCAG